MVAWVEAYEKIIEMIKRIYNKSPESIKHIIRKFKSKIIPFPYNLGRNFAKIYNKLIETQWYNIERLEELQLIKLKALINHAYENVPYYKMIFY
jgi:hypothetical protein